MGPSIDHYRRRARAKLAAWSNRVAAAGAIDRRLDARYRAALAAHRPALPLLDPAARAIVADLRATGVHVTSLAALGLGSPCAMVELVRTVAADHAASVRAMREDSLLLPDHPDQLQPVYRWGLAERLLDIAEAYLGLPVAYDGATVFHSIADGRVAGARAWHVDREDRRMLKVAIYCTDVGSEDGPFEILADGAGDARECVGPAGTVIFADTARCLHRGKPPTRNDRVAVFFSYFTARPRRPFLCERSGLARRDLRAMTADLSPRQQESARWHDALPWYVRWIPSDPV